MLFIILSIHLLSIKCPIGHFTQVVWKDSTELGVGCAKTDNGKTYVVANYNPPGNMMGKFKENVFPKTRY